MSANLEVLFSSTARVRVLDLFLLSPDRAYFQREIERETGQSLHAVQREVKRLTEIELLVRSEEGNRVFYRLNPEFPLLAELSALFQVAAGQEAGTAEAETPLPPEPSTLPQPFPWMETLAVPPLPDSLRDKQVAGEWDQAY